MAQSLRRPLHYVFKIGKRTETIKFYRDVLGMKILRHEEFDQGCEATCNGPYDGKWSKTMIGYGSEDDQFVVELTYNYGIGSYEHGNDFLGLTIHSTTIVEKAKQLGYPVSQEDDLSVLVCPDGYKFKIVNKSDEGSKSGPIKAYSLASSNLEKSLDFWTRLAGMTLFKQEGKKALLGFSEEQCQLELVDVGTQINHATAYGRIAFGFPREKVPEMEKLMKSENQTILTPLVSLPTPGKATVTVVIVADPDKHEICFATDEDFRQLSELDPNATELLDKAIEADKSDEWFAKKGKTKESA
ncbi:hypothetical protein EGW08_014696 [Elysia chlorotica]|uniref:VOC domain-containing protein n=1 Tax=Elysia chlorotica TaxID=188477 RepID=A0A3S0ZH61_ELYCH|nr:hypothetical protein EGW08_014696 [Elysia chlorotica]